jgi:ribosome-binding protein aMBF1 (putative translation factor)
MEDKEPTIPQDRARKVDSPTEHDTRGPSTLRSVLEKCSPPIIKDLVVCVQRDESGAVAAARDGTTKTAHHRDSATFRRVVVLLGRRVRKLRQEREWTVEEASERFGIEPAHVRRIEAGRTNPSLATLVSIAHGLNTDVISLLTKD